jgi:hypothetical protein
MKVFGVGLSKTGTTSLAKALEILGYKGVHFDTQRLNKIVIENVKSFSFDVYNDVDYVTDLPSSYFYKEIIDSYPEALVILTCREEGEWWDSMESHLKRHSVYKKGIRFAGWLLVRFGFDKGYLVDKYHEARVMEHIRRITYGSSAPKEFLFKKKYIEHNDSVRNYVPRERLLVMNISEGDGWDKLCPFLGVPVPPVEFPHANRAR